LPEFLRFWSGKAEVRKIWFSLFTPQVGELAEEILSPDERSRVLGELSDLKPEFPKLELPDQVLRGYRKPPQSPDECIFARTTLSITADLETRITPCQFGGNPDCSQCGCMASAGLKAVGDYRLGGLVSLRSIYGLSDRIGKTIGAARRGTGKRAAVASSVSWRLVGLDTSYEPAWVGTRDQSLFSIRCGQRRGERWLLHCVDGGGTRGKFYPHAWTRHFEICCLAELIEKSSAVR